MEETKLNMACALQRPSCLRAGSPLLRQLFTKVCQSISLPVLSSASSLGCPCLTISCSIYPCGPCTSSSSDGMFLDGKSILLRGSVLQGRLQISGPRLHSKSR